MGERNTCLIALCEVLNFARYLLTAKKTTLEMLRDFLSTVVSALRSSARMVKLSNPLQNVAGVLQQKNQEQSFFMCF